MDWSTLTGGQMQGGGETVGLVCSADGPGHSQSHPAAAEQHSQASPGWDGLRGW